MKPSPLYVHLTTVAAAHPATATPAVQHLPPPPIPVSRPSKLQGDPVLHPSTAKTEVSKDGESSVNKSTDCTVPDDPSNQIRDLGQNSSIGKFHSASMKISTNEVTSELRKPINDEVVKFLSSNKAKNSNIVQQLSKARATGKQDFSEVSASKQRIATMCISSYMGIKPGDCTKAKLNMPIGMCILKNKNIVVASTFEDEVKMFTSRGEFVKLVRPKLGFSHPSDMVTLRNGEFAIRDDKSVQIFNAEGNYLKSLDDRYFAGCKFYGLAQNEDGHLVVINENKPRKGMKKDQSNTKMMEDGTKPGEADLLFFDIETCEMMNKVCMKILN